MHFSIGVYFLQNITFFTGDYEVALLTATVEGFFLTGEFEL
jgi:hypothetical protein